MNPSIEIIYFVMLKCSGEVDIPGMPNRLKRKYYDLLEEMSVYMDRFFVRYNKIAFSNWIVNYELVA